MIIKLTDFVFSNLNVRCKNLYESTKKSYFFLYSEQEAKKSSNDAISIMWAWLRQIPKDIRYLVIWADNCVAQNKAWVIIHFWANIVKMGRLETVDLKFLERGKVHCFFKLQSS